MKAAPGPQVTDEALMRRFQDGDRTAFVSLVERQRTPLYSFALRHVRSAPAAEDIVQETFVRVVQKAQEFKHEAKFSTWVYTITRNLCVDHLRKSAHRRHASLDESAPGQSERGATLGERTADTRASVEREATGAELKERMARAIEALPDDQREVFLLRESSNLPFKEIASITGVPENTVKSRMRYALERLQEALREYEDYAQRLQ